MSHDPFKWRADEIRKAVESMEALMAAERAKLERLTAAVEGDRGVKPLARYGHVAAFRADAHVTVERAREELEKALTADKAIKEANDAAAAHNARIVEAAVSFCKGLGLPDQERYAEGREREPKLRTARWLKGIHGIVPPVPRWEDVTYTHARCVQAIDEWSRRMAAEKYAREAAERREQARLDAERERIAAELRREMQPSPQQALQERLREQVAAPAVMPEGSLSLAEALEIE